jgi:uncharacterized membrane protein YgdD (TMEM256/DUF423 family)
MLLIIGSLFGLLSVALGAYIEHGLAIQLDQAQLHMLNTAVRYQQTHAIMICVIGLIQLTKPAQLANKLVNLAGYLFVLGIILFSFGIYLVVIARQPSWINIVPWGGTSFMLAWLCLALVGGHAIYQRRKKR